MSYVTQGRHRLVLQTHTFPVCITSALCSGPLYTCLLKDELHCILNETLVQALPYVCLLIAMLFFIYAIIGMQVSREQLLRLLIPLTPSLV
jgi:hypothetical protein